MKYYIIHGRSEWSNKKNEFNYVTRSGCVNQYGFLCRYNNRRMAIRVSELALENNILKIYLGYKDYYLEEIDINNDKHISSLIYSYPEDIAPSDYLYDWRKQNNSEWAVSPSELLYLTGQFDNSILYKISQIIDGELKWLTDKYEWTTNKDLGIIITDDCIRFFKILFWRFKCELVSVDRNSHFSHIYYTYDDIDYFYDIGVIH